MKKQLLISILLFYGVFTGYSQGLYNLATLDEELDAAPLKWSAGVNFGYDDDVTDSHGIGLDAEVAYITAISDNIGVGAVVGVSHYFGKSETFGDVTIDFEDFTFAPLGVTARAKLGKSFFIGTNVGYALAIGPKDLDGGFYYEPKAGYRISSSKPTYIVASYSSIDVNGTAFSSINLGVEFGCLNSKK